MIDSAAVTLKEKARLFEWFTEENLVDPTGMLYCSIHSETLEPWTESDLSPEDENIPVAPFSSWDVINYENSGMTTGAYLAALSYQWRVTRDSSTLERARRTFKGIDHIYALGCQQKEGFFPKPYGGLYSPETSTDQYLYAIKGMMAYLPIAPEEDAVAIRRMIPKMVDFWVERGYRYAYFAIEDMLWPLGRFPALLLAAHAVSGDEGYRLEAECINREYKVYLNPTESQILRKVQEGVPFHELEHLWGDRYAGAWLPENAAMDIMGLDECLTHSDAHKEDWLRSMSLAWREGKLALTENGLARVWTLYDPLTGATSSPEPRFTGQADPLHWSFSQWVGGHLTPRSTMLARAGINVAKWLPAGDAATTVRQILEDISFDHMRHLIDLDGCQILSQHRFMCHRVDIDAITNWLWAYWQGRYENLIPSEEDTCAGLKVSV